MADRSVAWDELGKLVMNRRTDDEKSDSQVPGVYSASDAAANAMLEQRKLAQQVPVPTSDIHVRETLRRYDEPVTLFGEHEADRRARLLGVLIARHGKNAVHLSHAPVADAPEENDDDEDEEFFTEGSTDLLLARRRIAMYSLSRAKRRLSQQHFEAQSSLGDMAALRKSVLDPLKSYTSLGSQVAGERPVSIVRFSPDSSILATGCWSGKAALWEMPNASPLGTLHGTWRGSNRTQWLTRQLKHMKIV